jgi:hypothetical protein
MRRFGFDKFARVKFARVGHDRGHYTAFRIAMDYPGVVMRVAILDGVPILEALQRCNGSQGTVRILLSSLTGPRGRFGFASGAVRQEEVAMPAKTAAQQKAAGAALSAKRGENLKRKLRGASKQMADPMSEKQHKGLAQTKRKGKAEHTARS